MTAHDDHCKSRTTSPVLKLTFICPAFNGMPFIEHSLKSIYDFAHQIIVIEGATEDLMFAADPNGCSTDGTVQCVRSLDDPLNKITLIQGRWRDKCRKLNDALKYVTGDYLWLIEPGEVYKSSDLKTVNNLLTDDPSVSQIDFIAHRFWKILDHVIVSDLWLSPAYHCPRVFKYVPGSAFDQQGRLFSSVSSQPDQTRLLSADQTKQMHLAVCNYTYLSTAQVAARIKHCLRLGLNQLCGIDLVEWFNECFSKWSLGTGGQIEKKYPVWIEDRNSHTDLFNDTQPEAMVEYARNYDLHGRSYQPPCVMQNLIDVVNELKTAFPNDKIEVLETGTIRYFHEDSQSTRRIADALADRGHITTIDISPYSIMVSKQICRNAPNIDWILSDSVSALQRLKHRKFHLAFLDSVNNKDVIFEEFKLTVPMMIENGIIMIDDAGVTADGSQIDATVPAQKGRRVWQLLKDYDAQFQILPMPRSTGRQLKIPLHRQNLEKIKTALFGPQNTQQTDSSHPDLLTTVAALKADGQVHSAWKLAASHCVKHPADRQVLTVLHDLEQTRMCSEPHGTKISFAYLVLNGMPFLEYSLKSIYDFAHQIIIVEGAVKSCLFAANPDGSSTDGTVEFIRSFPDPDHKIKLIQGIWPEKKEMTNAALTHLTGDYVWLMAADEVYKRRDIEKIIGILAADPSVTQIDLIPYNFFKGLDFVMDSPRFYDPHLQYQGPIRFLPGARFINHRPVQLKYPGYILTAGEINRIDGTQTKRAGIRLYHYSYVLDEQVQQKIELYRRYGWGNSWQIDLEQWYKQCFLKWTPENRQQIEAKYPVWTGDPNSRTLPFGGTHPEVVKTLKEKLDRQRYVSEQLCLSVIGRPDYQRKVLDAWKHIEMDAPLRSRRDLIVGNIEQGNLFWNIHVALAFLADRLNPESYLEVGVSTGGSLVPLVHNCDVKEVVAVDMWAESCSGLPNTMEYAVGQISRYKAETNRNFEIEFIKGDSHVILNTLIASQRKFDLISVDGDHSEEGAQKDLNHAHLLLAEKGAIVFDDIIHPSHAYLMGVAARFAREHPEYKILFNSTQDNGCVIFLKGIDPADLLNCSPQESSYGRIAKPRVAAEHVHAGMSTNQKSSFDQSIQRLSARVSPARTIESENCCCKEATLGDAGFDLENHGQGTMPQRILWVRTDSIGDNVLASSMLPHVHGKYKNARITVLCQQHIAELYQSCPHVHDVVTFDRIQALRDTAYRAEAIRRIRALDVDLCLNSVYSREPLNDVFAISSGARNCIALDGDLCNTALHIKHSHDKHYTTLLPSPGEHKLELERHRDFLRGLGIDPAGLEPVIWLTAGDHDFADALFREVGFDPHNTIALFAGAQHACRIYEYYGKALSDLCTANRLSVLALGTDQDRDINQRNLDALSVPTVNLSGRTSIRQSAAVIKRCRLAVGAETALAHIACAVGTPNVILLGGGHFGRFMPYAPFTTIACLPLECYGCNWGCWYPRPHCIKDLSPDVLTEACRSALETRADKIRAFVQDPSAWQPALGQPRWQSFEKRLTCQNVEIVPVKSKHPIVSVCPMAPKPQPAVHDPSLSPRQSYAQDPAQMSIPPVTSITLATSLSPTKIERQSRAIETWLTLGFNVVSINCPEDIQLLQKSFSNITFVPTLRDARALFGKPLVFFDDVLDYFRRSSHDICGIANSDVILRADKGLIPFIHDQALGSLVYGSRTDVDSLESLNGEPYKDGFDFFFFDRSLADCFPRSEFCLGLPWWDYWAALMPALAAKPIKHLVSNFAYHVKHPIRWDLDQWQMLAKRFFGLLQPKIEQNFRHDPANDPWALLGRLFSAYHHQHLHAKRLKDKTQLHLGIIPPCILQFLDTKSAKIEYAPAQPPVHATPPSARDEKKTIFIHKDHLEQAPPESASAEYDASIVVCTKDRADLLDRMLTSLKEATRQTAYEVIVVEGGSCDHTMSVLGKHRPTAIYSESEWLGPGPHSWPQLYNFGFSKARGKWAMYASDDIVFAKDCVTRAVRLLNQQKSQVAGGIFFYKNIHPSDPQWADYGIDFTHGSKLLMNYGLVRRDHFKMVAGLDESYRFYCADSDFCYKLYERGWQLIPLAECFVAHDNVLDSQKKANMAQADNDLQRLLHRWRHLVPPDVPNPRRLMWQDDLLNAFSLPTELSLVDSRIEPYWHALACLQQGLFDQARQKFTEVFRSGCTHWLVLWYLAKAARLCSDQQLAREMTHAVIKLAPDFPDAHEFLDELTCQPVG